MNIDRRTRMLGGLALVVVSALVIFASSTTDSGVPLPLVGIAAIGVAAGTLLVGTSGTGRNV